MLHPDQIEEMKYDPWEEYRAVLRAEHYDPYLYEHDFEPLTEEEAKVAAELQKEAERIAAAIDSYYGEPPF